MRFAAVSEKCVTTKSPAPVDTSRKARTASHSLPTALTGIMSALIILITAHAAHAVYPQSAQHIKDISGNSFTSLVAMLKSPKALEVYVLANFRFQLDNEDRLKSIRRFMEDGYGDCEDYALFISTALQKMGYTVDIVEMHFRRGEDKIDHRIVIFHDHNTNKEYYLQGYPDGFTDGAISRPYGSKADLIRAIEKRWEADPGTFSYGLNSPGLLIITYGNNPELGVLP